MIGTEKLQTFNLEEFLCCYISELFTEQYHNKPVVKFCEVHGVTDWRYRLTTDTRCTLSKGVSMLKLYSCMTGQTWQRCKKLVKRLKVKLDRQYTFLDSLSKGQSMCWTYCYIRKKQKLLRAWEWSPVLTFSLLHTWPIAAWSECNCKFVNFRKYYLGPSSDVL